MNLKLKEVADLLQVSEKTIYRWVKAGKIPHRRINHQYRFHRAEIEQWLGSDGSGGAFAGNDSQLTPLSDVDTEEPRPSLLQRLKNGGIYYRVGSPDMETAIANSLDLTNIPPPLNRRTLLEIILRRESIAPTSVGRGIAFPHPREQVVPNPANENLSICFLESPIHDYAIDHEPIHTLIIILSSRPETHLRVLARLSFLCGQDDFLALLRERASRDDIFAFLERFSQWGTNQGPLNNW